ncbi:hypothetical protein YIM730264_16010 [Thermus hydrothermalis]|nr:MULTISPECIES: hypothetical protein [Thermus]
MRPKAWWVVGAALLLALGLAQEGDPREEARRQKKLLLQTAGIESEFNTKPAVGSR